MRFNFIKLTKNPKKIQRKNLKKWVKYTKIRKKFSTALIAFANESQLHIRRSIYRAYKLVHDTALLDFRYLKTHHSAVVAHQKKKKRQKKLDDAGIAKSYSLFSIIIMSFVVLWATIDAYSIYSKQVDDFHSSVKNKSSVIEKSLFHSINNIKNYLSYVGDKVALPLEVDYDNIADLLKKSMKFNINDNFYSWLHINYVSNDGEVIIDSNRGILKKPLPVDSRYPIKEAVDDVGTVIMGRLTHISNNLTEYTSLPIALSVFIDNKHRGVLISDIIVEKVRSDLEHSLGDKNLVYIAFDRNGDILAASEGYFNKNLTKELANNIERLLRKRKSRTDNSGIDSGENAQRYGSLKNSIRVNDTNFDFYRISSHDFVIFAGYSDETRFDTFLDKFKENTFRLLGFVGVFFFILYLFKKFKITPLVKELITRGNAAETASKAKSQFISNMSHELRTPMNGIMGMSQIVSDSANLPEEEEEQVDTIYRCADALLMILNDILDFSKIEAGKLEIENIDFNLRNVVGDVAELMSSSANGKGLEVIFHIDRNIPDILIGDAVRIRQILSNLINNSIKFTEFGQIFIEVLLEKYHENHYYVLFNVKDSGIGIEKSKIKNLFQKFTQADMSTTRKFGGTGLGLSICKELTEMMSGKIAIDSESGVGSNFHFTIPFLETQTAEDKDPKQEKLIKKLNGKKAVLIDSNDIGRSVLQDKLKYYEIDCRGVNLNNNKPKDDRSDDIIAQIKSFKETDLIVISFCKTSNFDITELVEKISQDSQLKSTPLILAISPYCKNFLDEEILQKFANVVSKPVRDERFLKTLLYTFGILKKKRLVYHNIEEKSEPNLNNDIKILLCEDNMVNSKVATRVLCDIGYQVDLAENGQEGVNKFLNIKYDIILMDCQMPIMDGFEATKKIRSIEKERGDGERIKIIALTANAKEEDRQSCIDIGMDDFTTKPLKKEEISGMIKSHCAKL